MKKLRFEAACVAVFLESRIRVTRSSNRKCRLCDFPCRCFDSRRLFEATRLADPERHHTSPKVARLKEDIDVKQIISPIIFLSSPVVNLLGI